MDFHDRLSAAMKVRGISNEALSKRIGRAPSYISNMMNKRANPGLTAVVQIALELEVSIDHLAGMSDQVKLTSAIEAEFEHRTAKAISAATDIFLKTLESEGHNVNVSIITKWWLENNGRLDSLGRLRDHFDLVESPAADGPVRKPIPGGGESLSSKILSGGDVDRLAVVFRAFDKPSRDAILDSYVGATRRVGKDLSYSIESIDVGVPELNTKIVAEYARLLLPVHDEKGKAYVLNYSQFLG